MIPELQTLNDAEVELVLKAPILVCILIAGADGTIDRKEVKEAIAITQKQKHTSGVLSRYLKENAVDFEDKFKIVIQGYPYDARQRNEIVMNELARLNALWKRLDKEFSLAFYDMLLNLAGRIASSSGGLLGINSIDEDEAKYISLPMINDPSKI